MKKKTRVVSTALALYLVIGTWKGYVALFDKGAEEPKQVFPCPVAALPQQDQEALQQGIIDGVENPFSTLYARKCQEVCSYLSMTAHQKILSLFFVSTDWFNSLSEEAQAALIQVATEAGDVFSKEMMPKDNAVALEAFKEAGVEIIEDVDIAAFKQATLSVYENWSVDVYNLIQEQMAAIAD